MNQELENYIQSNLEGLDTKKPDGAVLGRILEEMKSKKHDRAGGVVIPLQILKWAVACLLVAACAIALWYFNQQQPATGITKTKMPEKQPLQPPVTDPVKFPPAEVVRENTVAPKKALTHKTKATQPALFAGLYNMQSAASRISAIASASGVKNNDKIVIRTLVSVLNNDPNTNVRLAALDGLTRFYKETDVRQELVASLRKQQDPVVQINLIDLLTRIREPGILKDLDQLVNDEKTNKEVKDFAWSGILRLRPGIIN